MIKRIWNVLPWQLAAICVLAALALTPYFALDVLPSMLAEGHAEAIGPRHIFAAPVYVQNGTTVLFAFYEDGGYTGRDPLNTGSANFKGAVGADGGHFGWGGQPTMTEAWTSDGRIVAFEGHVTMTDGGAAVTFNYTDGGAFTYGDGGTAFIPECFANSHKTTVEGISILPTVIGATIAGLANSTSVVSWRCNGQAGL